MIKKIKAPIGDENKYRQKLFLLLVRYIKKIKAPIGDENCVIGAYFVGLIPLRK